MKPIAFVCHEASAGPGIMQEVLEADEVPTTLVPAWDTSFHWPRASDISGLVVLGGSMNVDETKEHPYLLHSRALIDEAIDADLPVLGICLGGQMIARVLGAGVKAGAAKEIGFHAVEATDSHDDVLDPITNLEGVFQWHEDAITLPPDAVLLHRNAVALQSFRYGHRTFAVQYHLEITEEIIRIWCRETESLEETWNTSESRLLAEAKSMLLPQQEAAAKVTRSFAALASGEAG